MAMFVKHFVLRYSNKYINKNPSYSKHKTCFYHYVTTKQLFTNLSYSFNVESVDSIGCTASESFRRKWRAF